MEVIKIIFKNLLTKNLNLVFNTANYTEVGTSSSSVFALNGNGFISYGTLSMGASKGKNLTDVYMNNGAFITWILDNFV